MSAGAAGSGRRELPLPGSGEAVAAPTGVREIDARALARHARRVARGPAPWLHEEVARRMAERLAVLREPPRRIVDWGARASGSEAALRGACPQARYVPVERFPAGPGDVGGPAEDLPRRPGRWRLPFLRVDTSRVETPESALPEEGADLLWSNMTLHHLDDPLQGMSRWLRLLREQGLLMFSTLGPGTLDSLNRVYMAEGWGEPFAPFVDMHDLGDMLVQAGFADPVMDQEVLTLTWATPAQALAELRQLGGNAGRHRHPGVRTPRWRGRLERAMARLAERGGARIALTFEVVYGHAVRPTPRVRVAPEAAVPLAQMRRMLRARPLDTAADAGADDDPPVPPKGPTR